MGIAGNPFPSDLQNELQTLQQAIAAGVTEVRFQDRTVRYASIKDMILAYNFIYQTLNGGAAGATGAPVRQVRCYTNKGL